MLDIERNFFISRPIKAPMASFEELRRRIYRQNEARATEFGDREAASDAIVAVARQVM